MTDTNTTGKLIDLAQDNQSQKQSQGRMTMRRGDLGALLLSCCFSIMASAAGAQAEKPRYGGTLDVGTVHVTISALSWDPGDWPWKFNHDAGQVYETLLAAD